MTAAWLYARAAADEAYDRLLQGAAIQILDSLVVEEGLEYAAAKRRAVKQLGLPARTPLPDNATLD
eukprot:gene3180-3745_t